MNHLEDATITSVLSYEGCVEYVLTGRLAGQEVRYTLEVDTYGTVAIPESQIVHHIPEDDSEPEYFTIRGVRVESVDVREASRTARELVARAHNYIAAARDQAIRDVMDGRYN